MCLLRQVVEERTEHKKPNATAHRVVVPKHVSMHAASTVVGAGSESVVPLSNVRTRAGSGKNDVNLLDGDIAGGPSEASGFSMLNNAASWPERGLSELLSKKSRLPHEDVEPVGDDARPKLLPQRSPFQTASEQLQVGVASCFMCGNCVDLTCMIPGANSVIGILVMSTTMSREAEIDGGVTMCVVLRVELTTPSTKIFFSAEVRMETTTGTYRGHLQSAKSLCLR